MVLAAGRGSRLQPLTASVPKPALPFMGIPMLRLAMKNVWDAGASSMHVNAWHLPDRIHEALEGSEERSTIEVHVENRLLGTAGGIHNALGRSPEGEVLVHNGDVLFCGSLAPLVEEHRKSGALASLGLIRVEDPSVPRSVHCDSEGRIFDFRGDDRAKGWTFSGIHVLSAAIFEHIVEEGCIVADVYRRFLKDGLIRGVPLQGTWADLGTIDRFREMHLQVLKSSTLRTFIRPDLKEMASVHPEASLASSVVLEAPYCIEAGAIIGEDVRIGPNCFVGAGAQVEAGARLSNSVVLPFSRAKGQKVEELCFETLPD